jgi:hypothetical protein
LLSKLKTDVGDELFIKKYIVWFESI